MNFVADNIDEIYRQICAELCKSETVNNTRELRNVSFELTNIDNNVINIRNISKSYLFGELMWYLNAREDMKFINKFAGLWGRISDNGITSNSAYGHILFVRHGFNQVEKIIELLQKDPNSRRAVLNFNVPNQNVITTKDEICTIALQMYIRNNKLYTTGIMRSNDIWFGTPYDVVFFTELQKYVARRLGIEVGTYTHFAVSLHVYDRNFEEFSKVKDSYSNTKIKLDGVKLFDKAKDICEQVEFSATPKEDIIKLFTDNGIYFEENV